MSDANNFKAQYKVNAGGAWSNAISGTEHSCLLKKTELEKRYKYVRVINANGTVIA